jgi:hypothetical protein
MISILLKRHEEKLREYVTESYTIGTVYVKAQRTSTNW